MEEVAHLIIRVSADQADAAKDKLKKLGYQAKETETATGGLMAAWKGLTGLLAATAALSVATAGLNKLLDTAKRFESLEAQLKTATGSAEGAAQAFAAIQDFAAQTPYDLAQSTEAFIKLVNLGLTPSERALRSYGDTASAMGKDLSTMVQAVANATTGEFEILKQFGVKARTESDGISFSFRGTTTKVKNDAKSIEDYFIALGEKNFGGAMLERMGTLEGKLSNLGDAWDVLFATIAKSGAGDVMKSTIDIAISAVTELTDMVASGQLAGYVDAIAGKFDMLAQDGLAAADWISKALDSIPDTVKSSVSEALGFVWNIFKNLPENFATFTRLGGAALQSLIDYAGATAGGMYEEFSGFFSYLIDTAVNVGKEVWSHLKPGASDFDYTKAQAEAFDRYTQKAAAAESAVAESFAETSKQLGQNVDAILAAHEKAIGSFDAEVLAANSLRAAYDALKAARQDASKGADRLARFSTRSPGASEEFNKLVLELRSQETVLRETYEKRKSIILNNTRSTETLLTEAEQNYKQNTESFSKIYEAELAALRSTYEKQKQIIVQATEGNAQARELALQKLDEQNTAELSKLTTAGDKKSAELKAQYETQKALIVEATKNNLELREQYLTKLEAQYAAEKQAAVANARATTPFNPDLKADELAVTLAAMKTAHQVEMAKQDDLYNAKLITQEQYLERKKNLELRYARDIEQINKDHVNNARTQTLNGYATMLGMAGDIAAQLDHLAEMSGKKSKALFFATKAISIAQAIVYTELAAVRALAEGGSIAGIPLSTAIRALGYTSVALMAGTAVAEYGQKFEHGGMIPAGKVGMTQEAGFELVRGPAVVSSARSTADMLAGQTGGGANVQVIVNNQTDAEATVEERDGPDGKIVEVLLRKVKGELASDIRNGGSAFARAIEGTYALRRGVA